MEIDTPFRMLEVEPVSSTTLPSSLRNTIVLFRRVLDHSTAGLTAARAEAMARAGADARTLPPYPAQEISPWR